LVLAAAELERQRLVALPGPMAFSQALPDSEAEESLAASTLLGLHETTAEVEQPSESPQDQAPRYGGNTTTKPRQEGKTIAA